MTYYEAAIQVLKIAHRPLTVREITDLAVERSLIVPGGKTPHASMSAALYKHSQLDQRLVKVATQVNVRSRNVRWSLRPDLASE